MRKYMLLVVAIFLTLTGCTKVDDSNLDSVVNSEVASGQVLVNQVARGYKYYLPRGVLVIQDHDFNQQFSLLDTYMYMYVDIVSYYYKNSLNDSDNRDNSYYYKAISHEDKTGYVLIRQEDNEYFVKIVYNYAKCEGYTRKDNLAKLVSYAIIILDSIQYNDMLVEKLINDTNVTSSEITYEIDKPVDSESKFSQYLSEYVSEEDTDDVVLPDEYKSE